LELTHVFFEQNGGFFDAIKSLRSAGRLLRSSKVTHTSLRLRRQPCRKNSAGVRLRALTAKYAMIYHYRLGGIHPCACAGSPAVKTPQESASEP
jgi:hypothetical protein